MPEIPFKEEDVLWRWTPTHRRPCDDSEEALVVEPNVRFPVLYSLIKPPYGGGWRRYGPIAPFVSELLRQLAAKAKRIEQLESLCVEAATELTKTLPADHPLRVKLEAAGDGKEIPCT